jgi:hypothetical protein
VLALAASALAFAQSPGPALRLDPQPELAPGVEAFPRLVDARLAGRGIGSRGVRGGGATGGATGADPSAAGGVARINGALDRAQQRMWANAKDCRDDSNHLAVSRWIDVTMLGPRFFSVVDHREYGCGLSPTESATPFVFDLETGRAVDWLRLLPPSFHAEGVLDTEPGLGTLGLVQSGALSKLYVDAAEDGAEADCKHAFDGIQLNFYLWPDAGQRALLVDQAQLPDAQRACGSPLTLSLAQMRQLKFAPALVDALASADPPPARPKQP